MTRYYDKEYHLMMSIRKHVEPDNKMVTKHDNEKTVDENTKSYNIEEEIKEIRHLGLQEDSSWLNSALFDRLFILPEGVT